MGKITLKAWAIAHSIDPSTARHKAIKGGFQTAEKIGRDWMIDADEPHADLRRKEKKE